MNIHYKVDGDNSRSNSEISEISQNMALYLKLEQETDKEFTREEKEVLINMNYRCLILHGREGKGKSTLVQAVCNEMNHELIEISNSSNRSAAQLDSMIYEATQSQNVFSRHESKMTVNRFC